MTRSRRRDLTQRNGFALVIVIWGLAIITLLIVTFMTTARWRLQAAFNISGAARANLLAESAIDATILSLASERNGGAFAAQRPIHDGQPRFCVLAGAATVIVVENESGKVDLNSASLQLLQATFAGFGVERLEAGILASAVVAFRTRPTNDIQTRDEDYAASGKPFGPKRAPFQSALELDQVIGVDPELFRTLTPFVTVHSHGSGIDAASAPPALFAALAGFSVDDVRAVMQSPFPNKLDRADPRFPAAFKQDADSGVFLVHAEAVLSTGQTGLGEAIVDMRNSASGPFALRERRHGAARYMDELRDISARGAAALPGC